MSQKIIITGAAGFIGSEVVRQILTETDWHVLSLDKLTYSSNIKALEPFKSHPRHNFEHADICDKSAIAAIFETFDPDAVMHLAAESHVDRSIDDPTQFIQTNVLGTCVLLEAARKHWRKLGGEKAEAFRFHHISTDEVYGSLGPNGHFTEQTPYDPRSPYSASKAASDHLVRAWHHTYKLPVIMSNCSNNYGPYQFPEKLIPLVISNALAGKPLPIYGDGKQIRDWIHVSDHARALRLILQKGRLGETYNVGSNSERFNIQVVETICDLLDELCPKPDKASYRAQMTFVTDRPGHDRRYAIDASKIRRELGWLPQETFETGLRKTVAWYLEHQHWLEEIRNKIYQGERLGLW